MRNRLMCIARAVLLVLLVSQGVLAAAPCVSAQATPADAFAAMPEGCHDAPPPTLCLQHCLVTDQTSGQAQLPLLMPPAEVLVVLPVFAYAAPPPTYPQLSGARAVGPPIPIRLLSLLL